MKIHHKIYLYVRAKQLKKIVPQNYEEKLKQIINNIDCSLPINFAPIDFPRITLDAATPIYPNKINFAYEWMVSLLLYGKQEDLDTFRMTVWHELAHLEKDMSPKGYHKEKRQLILWTNEVHADFVAAQKEINGRKLMVDAIVYKKKFKEKHTGHDKTSRSHPSWEKRLYYIENYKFNKKLIEKIAEDVGCNDDNLIQKISEYFEEITL